MSDEEAHSEPKCKCGEQLESILYSDEDVNAYWCPACGRAMVRELYCDKEDKWFVPVGIQEMEKTVKRLRKERNRLVDATELGKVSEGLEEDNRATDASIVRSAMHEIENLKGRRFPIQGGPSIPWRMIAPHNAQCLKNHCDQDLEGIAERKGLSPNEALAVLDDESSMKSKWGNFTTNWNTRESHPQIIAAKEELERRRAAFEDK